jgi:predicted oxidoreductase
LAGKLKIDGVTLSETVAAWNRDVRAGEDRLFGRNVTSDSVSLRIETALFYAVAIYPCLINTQGGPRRNERAQILDAMGDPIPRLYSAGELGSITILQAVSITP